ncbi:MAG: hypothetical protein ACE5GL_02455 [Calditrichia bacterium]
MDSLNCNYGYFGVYGGDYVAANNLLSEAENAGIEVLLEWGRQETTSAWYANDRGLRMNSFIWTIRCL